jgi:hypothetical protein
VPFLFAWLLWKGWHQIDVRTLEQLVPARSRDSNSLSRRGRGIQTACPGAVAGFKQRVPALLRDSNVPKLFLAGAVMLALILPWTLRNYRVYGEFLLLNSNTGYAMYAAQHPMHGVDFQEHTAAPLPDDLRGKSLNEAQWDRALMQRGLRFVKAEPWRYVRLSLSRVLDFFEFWPTSDTPLLHNVGRLVSFTAALPFMLAGSVLAVREARRRTRHRGPLAWLRQPPILLLTFAAVYALVHILTWAMPRYRIPVDAVMLPFAALALHHLLKTLKR